MARADTKGMILFTDTGSSGLRQGIAKSCVPKIVRSGKRQGKASFGLLAAIGKKTQSPGSKR